MAAAYANAYAEQAKSQLQAAFGRSDARNRTLQRVSHRNSRREFAIHRTIFAYKRQQRRLARERSDAMREKKMSIHINERVYGQKHEQQSSMSRGGGSGRHSSSNTCTKEGKNMKSDRVPMPLQRLQDVITALDLSSADASTLLGNNKREKGKHRKARSKIRTGTGHIDGTGARHVEEILDGLGITVSFSDERSMREREFENESDDDSNSSCNWRLDMTTRQFNRLLSRMCDVYLNPMELAEIAQCLPWVNPHSSSFAIASENKLSESGKTLVSRLMTIRSGEIQKLVEKLVELRPQFFLVRELSDKQLAELKKHFDRYDRDGSGTIEASELRAIMQSLGFRVKAGRAGNLQIHQLMAKVDTDGSGQVQHVRIEFILTCIC